MRIGLVGSRLYENKKKIKDFIFKLKQEHGTDTIIVSGGCKDGADKYIKKYTLEFGMNYKEYNPSYSGYNLYSAMPKTYYGKSYHFSQLHHRMKLIAQNCDYMIIMTNESTMDPFLKTAYSNINKQNKPVVLLG